MLRCLTGLFLGCASLCAPLWQASAASPAPWQWQNPTPHGNSLNAVSCPSVTTCYAVGSATAQVSQVPGQWTATLNRAWGSFSALSCPSATTCYAATNSGSSVGAILNTRDGGTTWTQVRPPGDVLFSFLSCPSTTVCYATGEYAGQVIATRNGGQSWSKQRITFRPVDLTCPTVTICYAPINTSLLSSPPPSVAVSSDGGKTWPLHAVGVQGQLWSTQCVSASTCYTVAFTGSDNGTPLFLRSADSGHTWSKHSFPKGTYFRGGSLTCPTASTCYIAGDNGTQTGILLATTNAGSSWVRRKPLSSLPSALACRDALHCVAVGVADNIESTSNGWSSWVEESHNVVRKLALPARGLALRAVACPSVSVCYADGDLTTFVTTSNAGGTWQSRSGGLSRSHVSGNFTTLACATTTTCFAGTTPVYPPGLQSGNQVFATTDGGKTWKANPGKRFVVVACPSSTVCYAGGEKGAMQVSRNGGQTWTSKTTPLSGKHYTIREMTCPTVSVCYAGAIGPSEPPPHPESFVGALLSTSNGGKTWTQRNTDPYPLAVACRTTTDCFALLVNTFNAKNLVTHDGGKTWSAYTALAAGPWSSMSCPDTTTCYVTGQGGNVRVTHDGGATWAPEDTTTFNALYGVTCASSGECYAVGDFGAILARPPSS